MKLFFGVFISAILFIPCQSFAKCIRYSSSASTASLGSYCCDKDSEPSDPNLECTRNSDQKASCNPIGDKQPWSLWNCKPCPASSEDLTRSVTKRLAAATLVINAASSGTLMESKGPQPVGSHSESSQITKGIQPTDVTAQKKKERPISDSDMIAHAAYYPFVRAMEEGLYNQGLIPVRHLYYMQDTNKDVGSSNLKFQRTLTNKFLNETAKNWLGQVFPRTENLLKIKESLAKKLLEMTKFQKGKTGEPEEALQEEQLKKQAQELRQIRETLIHEFENEVTKGEDDWSGLLEPEKRAVLEFGHVFFGTEKDRDLELIRKATPLFQMKIPTFLRAARDQLVDIEAATSSRVTNATGVYEVVLENGKPKLIQYEGQKAVEVQTPPLLLDAVESPFGRVFAGGSHPYLAVTVRLPFLRYAEEANLADKFTRNKSGHYKASPDSSIYKKQNFFVQKLGWRFITEEPEVNKSTPDQNSEQKGSVSSSQSSPQDQSQ